MARERGGAFLLLLLLLLLLIERVLLRLLRPQRDGVFVRGDGGRVKHAAQRVKHACRGRDILILWYYRQYTK